MQPHGIPDPSSRLRAALHLPLSSRKIADWIFDERDVSFRSNATLVSPDFLEKSVYVVVRSAVSPSEEGLEPTSDPMSTTSQGNESNPAPACLFMALIPAEVVDGVIIGYTFHVGTPLDPELLDLRGALNSTFGQVARFAFDGMRRHLVVYIPSYTIDRDLLAVMEWTSALDREVTHISIPSQQYSFDEPPSKVLSATVVRQANILRPLRRSHLQSPLVTTDLFAQTSQVVESALKVSGILSDTTDVASMHPHLLDDFIPNCETLQRYPSGAFCLEEQPYPVIDGAEGGSDGIDSGIAIPFVAQSSLLLPTSQLAAVMANSVEQNVNGSVSVSFEISPMGLWIEQMTETLIGNFGGCIETQAFGQSCRYGNFREHCNLANAEEQQMLSVFSSRTYYADTLAVTTDCRLLNSTEDPEYRPDH